jgi:hypothetical protein
MEVSGQFHAPAALLVGKERHRDDLYRRLGVPQSRAGPYGEEKISCPYEELNRLSYRGS